MVGKPNSHIRTARRLSPNVQATLSRQGIGIFMGLAVAVATLWFITASRQLNEWYFFERYTNPIFALNMILSYVAFLCAYALAWKGDRKERALRVAAHLGTLTALLIMIELPAAIGLFDYRSLVSPKMIGGQGPHNRIYEAGLYWHRPPLDEFVNELSGDTSMRLALREPPTYVANHRYDRNGFRNDRDLEQAEVVLIGDSFVEGYKVSQNEMFSTKLANFLQTDVANLGMAGFGPQNELGVLREVGLELEPKVIVWLFFEGNDLYNYEEERRLWARRAGGWRERLLTTNILKVTNRLSLRLVPSEQRELRVPYALTAPPLSKELTRIYFDEIATETVKTAAYLEECEEFIEQASELSLQSGARFIFVYIPTKFSVYKDLVDVIHNIPTDLQSASYASSFAQWSKGKGIEFHDLTPWLTGSARDGEQVYFPDDEHWTPVGNTLVARKIAEIIRTDPSLPQ